MRMPSARPYDLTLAGGDFPPWAGPPERSIVLCSHPRSGSTLLGEALQSAGGLGCPLEYLHRGFRPTIARRWAAPDLNAYVAALHRRRTGPNGVLSIKLFWQDLEEIAVEDAAGAGGPAPVCRPPEDMRPEDYQSLFALLTRFLPNPEFIYLDRADRVRQAVSAMVAAQTGLWRSIQGVGRQSAVAEATFDYERILANLVLADDSRAHWRGFFAANAISPRIVTYEALDADYAATVGDLLARLGAENTTPPPQRMRRQADSTSEAMVLRFLREYAARAT